MIIVTNTVPSGYTWKTNIHDVKVLIEYCEEVCGSVSNNFIDPYREEIMKYYKVTIVDVEKDGDFNDLLKWLKETDRNYQVRFH